MTVCSSVTLFSFTVANWSSNLRWALSSAPTLFSLEFSHVSQISLPQNGPNRSSLRKVSAWAARYNAQGLTCMFQRLQIFASSHFCFSLTVIKTSIWYPAF